MAAVRAVLILATLIVVLVLAIPLRWISARGSRSWTDGMLRLSCRVLLRCLGIRVRTFNFVPGTPRLLVANHVSWLDVLVLGRVEPLCFLAKREVRSWPFVGPLSRLQGTIFVDRARRRSIPATNLAMAARLREGRSVLLFPEGTTHDGTRLGRFHTSHLACLRDRLRDGSGNATAWVQPVTIRYSDQAAAWIGEETLIPHVWAVLNRPPIISDVVYGALIAVDAAIDRKVLGATLATAVEMARAPVPPVGAGSATHGPRATGSLVDSAT